MRNTTPSPQGFAVLGLAFITATTAVLVNSVFADDPDKTEGKSSSYVAKPEDLLACGLEGA